MVWFSKLSGYHDCLDAFLSQVYKKQYLFSNLVGVGGSLQQPSLGFFSAKFGPPPPPPTHFESMTYMFWRSDLKRFHVYKNNVFGILSLLYSF